MPVPLPAPEVAAIAARKIEQFEETWGSDMLARVAVAELVARGYPDAAYEALVLIGEPVLEAFNIVMDAADLHGLDEEMVFELLVLGAPDWSG